MKNTNETNRIKKLFQDAEFMNAVIRTLATHHDVLAGVAMVRSISKMTGKAPIRVVDDLVSENKKNETNRIKELFQDAEFMNAVLTTLTTPPDVLDGATMVRGISKMTGKAPFRVVDDLVSEKNETRFVSVIKKVNNLKQGPFANMFLDIEDFTKNMPSNIRVDNLLLLTYQLAGWYISAGLYVQGLFNTEQYTSAFDELTKVSQEIGESEEFENEANEQAIEFVLSYSPRLSRGLIEYFLLIVSDKKISCLNDEGLEMEFDDMIELYLPIYTESKSDEIT